MSSIAVPRAKSSPLRIYIYIYIEREREREKERESDMRRSNVYA